MEPATHALRRSAQVAAAAAHLNPTPTTARQMVCAQSLHTPVVCNSTFDLAARSRQQGLRGKRHITPCMARHMEYCRSLSRSSSLSIRLLAAHQRRLEQLPQKFALHPAATPCLPAWRAVLYSGSQREEDLILRRPVLWYSCSSKCWHENMEKEPVQIQASAGTAGKISQQRNSCSVHVQAAWREHNQGSCTGSRNSFNNPSPKSNDFPAPAGPLISPEWLAVARLGRPATKQMKRPAPADTESLENVVQVRLEAHRRAYL